MDEKNSVGVNKVASYKDGNNSDNGDDSDDDDDETGEEIMRLAARDLLSSNV